MLADVHAAAELRHLVEREPERRLVALTAEDEEIDAAVRRAADVPRQADRGIPRPLPRNGSRLEQAEDAIDDDFVRLHLCCPPSLRPVREPALSPDPESRSRRAAPERRGAARNLGKARDRSAAKGARL